MIRQIRAKFLDRLARLHDLFNFLPREEVLHIHLLGHNLLPNVDHAHGEGEREVDEEDGRAELEQAEVLQVQVEEVLLRCLGSGCSLLRFFVLSSLLLLLQIELKDIVNLRLLAHSDVLLALHERVL